MALKDLLSTVKQPDSLSKRLDIFLATLEDEEDKDRALNINAPSSIGGCMRARYYGRVRVRKDSGIMNGRVRRIFDNGKYVHKRLQKYYRLMGILLMDEVPVLDPDLNIQGHTDAMLDVDGLLAVLEIKSIKQELFSPLKVAEPKHVKQALSYLMSLAKRQRFLHDNYVCMADLLRDFPRLRLYYARFYQHLKSDEKHTRESKIRYQVNLNLTKDLILFRYKKTIDRCYIQYENKNDQTMKEYLVTLSDPRTRMLVKEVEDECELMEDYVARRKVPPRCEDARKDVMPCRFCDYKSECWVV